MNELLKQALIVGIILLVVSVIVVSIEYPIFVMSISGLIILIALYITLQVFNDKRDYRKLEMYAKVLSHQKEDHGLLKVVLGNMMKNMQHIDHTDQHHNLRRLPEPEVININQDQIQEDFLIPATEYSKD